MSYWVYPAPAPVTEPLVTPPPLVIPSICHGELIDDELGGITLPEEDGGSNKSGDDDKCSADDEDDVGRHDAGGSGIDFFKSVRRSD